MVNIDPRAKWKYRAQGIALALIVEGALAALWVMAQIAMGLAAMARFG